KAMHAKTNNGKPEIIDANMLQAVSIAEKIAPYRHHRLAAIKLNKDPVDPALRVEASLEELRVEMLKHWGRLVPVLDLEVRSAPVTALPIARCKRDDVAQFPIGQVTLIGTGQVGTDGGTVLIVAPIDTETAYPRPFRASWTLPPDGTMMSSNPE